MSKSLFPVIETPEIQAVQQYDRTYRESYQWDYQTGDFMRDGAKRIPKCDGAEAYKTWCMKAVMTERKTCLAYPDTVGAEINAAFQKPSRKAQESAIERTIRETSGQSLSRILRLPGRAILFRLPLLLKALIRTVFGWRCKQCRNVQSL